MKSIAVYTALIGPYDQLRNPPADPHCDYFCFTDNRDLTSTRFEMIHVDSAGRNPTRLARYHKILSHRVLPQYRYTIWIDTSVDFRFQDIETFVREAVREHPIALHSHPRNADVYRELELCLRLEKDDPAVMRAQVQRYRDQGLPEGTGMVHSAVVVRDSAHPRLREFEDAWWREIEKGSFRDQLSFNFVSWKLNFPYAVLAQAELAPVFRSPYFDFWLHTPPPR